MRVLDTSALLNWPPEKINGGCCAFSQLQELANLSSSKSMLLESLDIQWIEPSDEMKSEARRCAMQTGDLAGLSEVDIEVLSLAITNHGATLYTDDYRLQNIARAFDISFESVVVKTSTKQWTWHMKCEGCRATSPVAQYVDTTRKNITIECEICGSQMKLKRKN